MSDLTTQPLRDHSLYEELDKQFGVVRELHDSARRIAERAKYCRRKYSREIVEDGTMSMGSVLLYRLVPSHTEPVPPGLGRVDHWDAAVVHRELDNCGCGKTLEEAANALVRVPAQLVVDAIDFRLGRLRQNRREEISRRVEESLEKRRADSPEAKKLLEGNDIGPVLTNTQQNCYICASFVWDEDTNTGECMYHSDPDRHKHIDNPLLSWCSRWSSVKEGCECESTSPEKQEEIARANGLRKQWACDSCVHMSLGWCTANGYRTRAGLDPVCVNQLLPVAGLDPEKVTVE